MHQSKQKEEQFLKPRERRELTRANEADTLTVVVYFRCFQPVFTRLCFYSKSGFALRLADNRILLSARQTPSVALESNLNRLIHFSRIFINA